MFFAIKIVGQDIWAGKKDITWFISDNSTINQFGVSIKQRRIFSSTDEIRRSLREVAKESIIISGNTQSINFRSFSNFEVVEVITGSIHPLHDVLIKKI